MRDHLHRLRWSVLLLLGFILVACANFAKPEVPNIEPYLPRDVIGTKPEPAPNAESIIGGSGERVTNNVHEKPLTLEACVQIALDHNPMNRAAQAGVMAAKEATGEARAPYYPELGFNAGYSRWQKHAFLPSGLGPPNAQIPTVIGPTDDWIAGLKARFTLFDSGERQAQLRSALAREGMAEEDAVSIRQDMVLNVHQAYYGFVAATETRSVADENLARAENHLRLAKERKAAGAVPQADVIRTEVEVANAKLTLVKAENLVRVSRGDLNTSMGLPVEMMIEIEAKPGEITSPEGVDISTSFDQAVHTRPELKATLQRLAAARSSVDSAKSAFGPKLKAEGGYGWRDSGFLPRDEEWTAGMTIDLPIFTGFSRIHRLDRTKAELSKEEAELEQLILNVRQEVWTAHSKFKEAYEAVQVAQVVVQDAEESMRLTRARYEAGAGTINDLLDTQTALARAKATLVETQWDYHIAKAVFDRSIGNMVVENNF